MSEQGTAVATTASEHPEVAAIRESGGLFVAKQKELNAMTKMLDGMTWGNVKGTSLSAETRYAIARVCMAYDADPAIDIHILGGAIYLNAAYWARQLNSLPNLKDWHQENIGPRHIKSLREQAEQAMKDAKAFEDPGMADRARDLIRASQDAEERRSFFGIPDNAQEAYETIVEFTDRGPVREANYSPNGPNDPVGKARPAETARSRSMRRAAVKASPHMRTLEERALRNAVKAEFEVIASVQNEARASLPAEGEKQALRVGAGEPTAAKVEAAPKVEVGTRRKPAPEPQQQRQPSEAEQRFISGCEALGIEDRDAFAQETLGRLPLDDEDFRTLGVELARIADA